MTPKGHKGRKHGKKFSYRITNKFAIGTNRKFFTSLLIVSLTSFLSSFSNSSTLRLHSSHVHVSAILSIQDIMNKDLNSGVAFFPEFFSK